MKILGIHPRRVTSSISARSLLYLCAALIVGSYSATAQSNRERRLLLNEYVSPEELISMSKTLPFDKSVSLFTDFSKKYLNKIIVDPLNNKKEIGVDIENMYWLQAFETVLRANALWYEEREEYFQITNPADSLKGGVPTGGGAAVAKDSVSKALLLARDIKISTVFFSVDVSKSLSTGINWNYLYYGDTTSGKATQFGGQLASNLQDPTKSTSSSGSGGSSGSQLQTEGFLGRVIPNIRFSNLTGFVSFLQKNGLGDVISSPQLIVSSGKKGQIQIGSDHYIDTKDFSGNIIKTKVSTGIIVSITPTLYVEKGVRFMNLDTHVENSSFNADASVTKSSIDTYLLMNDGEETVIGGLYSTNETNARSGIPFLKDLPWYIFGLRYIFGSEVKEEAKSEVIVLLKAEVVPTIEERLADKLKRNENQIEKTRKEFDDDIAKRKPKEKE
jgi:type IV pilus assembly protein PilQ